MKGQKEVQDMANRSTNLQVQTEKSERWKRKDHLDRKEAVVEMPR